MSNEFYELIKDITNSFSKILFLTATPALSNINILYNLLSILDPDNYDLISLNELKERVDKVILLEIFKRNEKRRIGYSFKTKN